MAGYPRKISACRDRIRRAEAYCSAEMSNIVMHKIEVDFVERIYTLWRENGVNAAV